ncbi:hypothetical protein H2248_011173 [Termitomyces sp. 'cryptogamus']|nr:hypothetical protein H2248_011173 [Termitomyces sp. 'cryptogamus']
MYDLPVDAWSASGIASNATLPVFVLFSAMYPMLIALFVHGPSRIIDETWVADVTGEFGGLTQLVEDSPLNRGNSI